jgi:hypothetical protein
MTRVKKLEALIQKAIDGGWDFDGLLAPMDPGKYEVIAPFGGDYLRIKTTSWSGEESFENINAVIYSKNLAKALWGNGEISICGNSAPFDDVVTGREVAWQYHLQQAVIAEDPISYMYEAVFGKEVK